MNEWIQRQIDNGFADFKGLSIQGQIPIKDRLLNELLAEFLRDASTPASPSAPSAKPDVRALLKLVKKVEVRAVDGAIVVDVAIDA